MEESDACKTLEQLNYTLLHAYNMHFKVLFKVTKVKMSGKSLIYVKNRK